MQDGSRPAALARVPPNNLRAEESVLGAMLLSREAIAEVVEVLDPDHFYKPAHGHLYDAILSLYSGGEPVDAVTVADELKRAGLLDEVGGPAVLLDFQATTPAISNAAHYAKIVEEHALLRRMIVVSNEIAEVAYGVPDDVVKAVDDAEARIFDVAQRRVANTMAPIKELLPANLDRIEMLYDRGESITGLSTGYLDLDERLAGLQPSALYVVGARPAMGKALALDTPIATADGWSTMGDLRVGDAVFDEQGRSCTVTYKSPVFVDHDCFEVEFDDGSVIVADADHQWFTVDHQAWGLRRDHSDRQAESSAAPAERSSDRSSERSGPAVRTTAEIAATLRTGPSAEERPNHRVQLAEPLDLPEVDLPLDPYILGCWLGSGDTERARITTTDAEIVDAFTLDGWSLEPTTVAGEATTYTIRSPLDDEPDRDRSGGPRMPWFTRQLRDSGLWESGRRPDPGRKHIPAIYLRASTKQRLALLQGIMDTNGTIRRGRTTCELGLPAERLLSDTRELALTLGYNAGPVRRERADSDSDGWSFVFSAPEPVFRLSRKANAQIVADDPNGTSRWRVITDVRPVPPVPVQCITVDSPTHLYLAGRELIPTHNTAFALGLAANSAMKDGRPVLIFTLEMSQLELSQRLLCSEALVDAGRVKTGRLEEGEWNRISHAVGRLAEAPIYIDDNPHTSVLDIRAKARRLKSREGDLGMVVVDYVQLMTGRSSAESRQVEVSEISRNLKILARELEAPVVALAQLNRSLEQRTDKRPMLSDLRESGCMPAATRVLLADGSEVTMGELLLTGATPDVVAVDDQQRVVHRRLLRTFPSGIKPVYRMRLASGREVDATANHRFLTIDGWQPLGELAVGDAVATPRRLPEPPAPESWPDDEVVLLAHLLAGGSIPSEQDRPHPLGARLESLGVRGEQCNEQTIPEQIHRLSCRQAALFLRHLWATDGSTLTGNRGGPLVRCSYSSRSRPLAVGVQGLLLRFGIAGTIERVEQAPGHPEWMVRVAGPRDQLQLRSIIDGHQARAANVDSDVVWDEIASIEPLGEQPVFDVTVDEVHDFVANGIVAHNSLEQDADVVLFLYRDEIYDDNSPDKGVAEIIIAKHRNGPTGRARLAFRGQYTRFDNMARSVPPGSGPSRSEEGRADSIEF